MLYRFIKITVKLALKIFCRRMVIKGGKSLSGRGPILITANHPNSFLDAIIIGSLFDRPVHFLARGDAFTRPWHGRLLRVLNMIPVYRLSEGRENLFLNEDSFRRSKEILSQNGIVLIFIEGICVHKHELQAFKKGAARIAMESKEKEHFTILPIAISYDSFSRFGKLVNINFGDALLPAQLFPFEEEAKNIRNFNTVLFDKINALIDVPVNKIHITKTKKYFLFLPAFAGFLLHVLFYTGIKKRVARKTKDTVFFDSVLFGVLLFLYPLYVLLLCFLLILLHVPILIIAGIFFLFPVLAWCATMVFVNPMLPQKHRSTE